MEKWHKEIIKKNHTFLIENVKCSTILLSKLYERDVFSKHNVEIVEVKRTQLDKACELLECLTKKHHGFDIFISVLSEIEGRETAAVKLLLLEERYKHYANRGHPVPPLINVPKRNISGDCPGIQCLTGAPAIVDVSYNNITSPTEIQDYFDGKGTKLNVKVTQPVDVNPRKCRYILPPKGCGYAFILNIMEIRGEPIRKGADVDAAYMTQLWEGLGFKIFPPDETFRERRFKFHKEIKEELQKFKTKCIEDKADAIVVYIASHGYTNDVILTSDNKTLDIYNDFIYPFQFDNFVDEKRVPKIFINQYCKLSSSEPTSNDGSDGCGFIKPSFDVKDTMYIKAKIPIEYITLAPSSEFNVGSNFVIVLTTVLMTKSWNTSFLTMLDEVQELLKRVSDDVCQLSPIMQIGFSHPLFFFTPNNGL